jgi:hypothetical protein
MALTTSQKRLVMVMFLMGLAVFLPILIFGIL